jgi:hypothetical protein
MDIYTNSNEYTSAQYSRTEVLTNLSKTVIFNSSALLFIGFAISLFYL